MMALRLAAIDQDQTRGRACSALRASMPAADQLQDRPVLTLRAGFRWVTSKLLPRSRRYLPGRAIAAAPGLFIPAIDRANGLRPHTFEHQPPVKLIAAAPSHLNRLSKLASSAGSNNASKWRQGRGNSLQRRGFFIQGAGRDD